VNEFAQGSDTRVEGSNQCHYVLVTVFLNSIVLFCLLKCLMFLLTYSSVCDQYNIYHHKKRCATASCVTRDR